MCTRATNRTGIVANRRREGAKTDWIEMKLFAVKISSNLFALKTIYRFPVYVEVIANLNTLLQRTYRTRTGKDLTRKKSNTN